MVVVEARLNVMQTVFLALRSFSDPAQAEPSDTLLADSQKIFHTLFNRYFDVDMEVCRSHVYKKNFTVEQIFVGILKGLQFWWNK